jgi:hypothetical protein
VVKIMPNHIKNIVDFSDFSTNQFKKIQDEICGDEILDDGEKRLFDFLKIIPAPDHPIYPLEDNEDISRKNGRASTTKLS